LNGGGVKNQRHEGLIPQEIPLSLRLAGFSGKKTLTK
jgi:hypothetical protein